MCKISVLYREGKWLFIAIYWGVLYLCTFKKVEVNGYSMSIARQNQAICTGKVLEDTRIIEAWERIGATVHLVGSLRTGLLGESRI